MHIHMPSYSSSLAKIHGWVIIPRYLSILGLPVELAIPIINQTPFCANSTEVLLIEHGTIQEDQQTKNVGR
jgi:hypothetical protein